jgi:aconitate hydratase
MWNEVKVPTADFYSWDPKSSYIREPPFFQGITSDPPGPSSINDAYCLSSFSDCNN